MGLEVVGLCVHWGSSLFDKRSLVKAFGNGFPVEGIIICPIEFPGWIDGSSSDGHG